MSSSNRARLSAFHSENCTGYDALKNDYLRVGQIVRAHGVHGDVKIIPLTNDPDRFRKLKTAYLETTAGAYAPVAVTSARFMPDAVLLHLEGYDSMERAETLKNVYLCVSRDNAVKLDKDTYFIVDLIGCETFDTDGKAYGKVTNVLETGAHDVYEIENGKLLVPALKKLLREVDVENARIVFDAEVLGEVGCFAD
ncbi:MAG TPA: 16S rRNA processing protein RimM [Clostridiales bacterium]|nr:16S rRNA processing protein RimM [Clostridiales bacterium]